MKKWIFITLMLPMQLMAQDFLNLKVMGTHDSGSIDYNDVWGYVYEGDEYVVYGASDGINFMKVTDCSNPILEYMWEDNNNNVIWRDFKTYDQYIYAVCDGGACDEGLLVFDMADLDAAPYQTTAQFQDSHNIFVDTENARLYAVGVPGANDLYIYDLSNTPGEPELLSALNLNDFGPDENWYIHDIYVNDNIAYCSHGYTGYAIWDMTNAANPVLKGTRPGSSSHYNHSSWPTEDLNYIYLAEEVPQRPLTILDVSDIEDIEFIKEFSDPLLPNASTVNRPHNPFVLGDLLYISYYHDGIKIYDISDPENPVVEGYYDTYEGHTHYGGYHGAWGAYPYLPSGCIAICDIESGLFLFNHYVTTSSKVENADLVFGESGDGIIFRTSREDLARLSADATGALIVTPLASLPAEYEEIKRSNLYLTDHTTGPVTTSGGKYFRMSIDDFGTITNDFIGNAAPSVRLESTNKDFYLSSPGSALIMKSPNGSCWRITISASNGIIKETIICPN